MLVFAPPFNLLQTLLRIYFNFFFLDKSLSDETANYFDHMGLKDFPDESFSASSQKDGKTKPKHARLDGDSAWCPHKSDHTPALYIRVPKMQAEIVGIVTQGGREDNGKEGFVRYYTVADNANQYHSAGGKTVRFIHYALIQ